MVKEGKGMSYFEKVADEAAQEGCGLRRANTFGQHIVYITTPDLSAQFFKMCKWTPKDRAYDMLVNWGVRIGPHVRSKWAKRTVFWAARLDCYDSGTCTDKHARKGVCINRSCLRQSMGFQ